MLQLRDFYHLAQLDPFFNRMTAEESGLIVLAGIDSRPVSALGGDLDEYLPGDVFLPSGLSGLFDIFMQTILTERPEVEAVVVAREKSVARAPRGLKRRIRLLPVEGGFSYDRQVQNALEFKPGLLVIDRLTVESAPAVFHAARTGVKVLAAMDSALRGAGLVRHLLGLGSGSDDLAGLTWVLSMQRLPALCSNCRRQIHLSAQARGWLRQRFPFDEKLSDAGPVFWQACGCQNCRHTGRSGDVAVFDVYRADRETGLPAPLSYLDTPSLFSMENYIYDLAAQGLLALDDLLWLETDQLRRTYTLFSASGHALSQATTTLQRKLFELEASNRVLVQRTEVLMSLEDLGQALIESEDLNELAKRICRRAGELCGADRAILYLLRQDAPGEETAEVLAAWGWDAVSIARNLAAAMVIDASAKKAQRFVSLPPGVDIPAVGADGKPHATIQSGLRVPLLAQDRLVGSMIIQSTQKQSFTPGEAALLQTFANQAALAIQRAGLVDELRAKIIELEAAQAELVQKERLEREMELARQVQQSLLPRVFPRLEGFALAARTQPAHQVGGDFYDVIVLDPDHFGIVVADVSDKGLPAAMYMGLSRSLLIAESHRGLSPQTALESVNRLLLELGELNGFVSVFYGVVEISTRKMRYTRAGHERPWLLRSGALGWECIQLAGSGTVLGIMSSDQLRLSEEEIDLVSADRLVLFTDGISDATDADGRFFGGERLGGLLKRRADLSAENLCEEIFHHLVVFSAHTDPFDDMTLLILEVQ